MQKSTALLVPMMNFKYYVYPHLINTYVGNIHFEGDDDWGKYFHIQMSADTPSEILAELRNHSWYVIEEHFADPASIMFTFQPDAEITSSILSPFIKGKYSQIDRGYVNKHFSYKVNGMPNHNYLVLTKHPSLKAYWEERLNVTLPEDAEVWSKPEKKDEVFGYEEYKLHIAELEMCAP